MALLFAWVIFAIAIAAVAQSRGRSAGEYFLLSLLLSPLLAVLVLLLTKPTRAQADALAMRGGDVKRCPLCAELVKAEAMVCKHCHQPIAATAVVLSTPPVSEPLTVTPPRMSVSRGSTGAGAKPAFSRVTMGLALVVVAMASVYVFVGLGL